MRREVGEGVRKGKVFSFEKWRRNSAFSERLPARERKENLLLTILLPLRPCCFSDGQRQETLIIVSQDDSGARRRAPRDPSDHDDASAVRALLLSVDGNAAAWFQEEKRETTALRDQPLARLPRASRPPPRFAPPPPLLAPLSPRRHRVLSQRSRRRTPRQQSLSAILHATAALNGMRTAMADGRSATPSLRDLAHLSSSTRTRGSA